MQKRKKRNRKKSFYFFIIYRTGKNTKVDCLLTMNWSEKKIMKPIFTLISTEKATTKNLQKKLKKYDVTMERTKYTLFYTQKKLLWIFWMPNCWHENQRNLFLLSFISILLDFHAFLLQFRFLFSTFSIRTVLLIFVDCCRAWRLKYFLFCSFSAFFFCCCCCCCDVYFLPWWDFFLTNQINNWLRQKNFYARI